MLMKPRVRVKVIEYSKIMKLKRRFAVQLQSLGKEAGRGTRFEDTTVDVSRWQTMAEAKSAAVVLRKALRWGPHGDRPLQGFYAKQLVMTLNVASADDLPSSSWFTESGKKNRVTNTKGIVVAHFFHTGANVHAYRVRHEGDGDTEALYLENELVDFAPVGSTDFKSCEYRTRTVLELRDVLQVRFTDDVLYRRKPDVTGVIVRQMFFPKNYSLYWLEHPDRTVAPYEGNELVGTTRHGTALKAVPEGFTVPLCGKCWKKGTKPFQRAKGIYMGQCLVCRRELMDGMGASGVRFVRPEKKE